jgi:hypothetical protein
MVAKSLNMNGPAIQLGRRKLLAFQVCACAGLAIGVAINIGLAARLNLPAKVAVLTSALGLFLIPVIAMATKIIGGEEELCFYYDLITVPTVTASVLWLLGQPVLPFLDTLVLAIGAARALGYFGCLKAGCCHGSPSKWGVIYSEKYASVLPQRLIGLPLFPIQVVEALWTAGAVVIGCALVAQTQRPGIGLTWFVATYCPARFVFECLRWPPKYHFRSGLSQHQWISVALLMLVVLLEFVGVLPLQAWHAVITLLLILATAFLIVDRQTRSQLNHPEHIRELTEAIAQASLIRTPQQVATSIPIRRTSLGLQVSAEKIERPNDVVHHFAFSSKAGLSDVAANDVAQCIVRVQNLPGPFELLTGNNGVFHLLVHSARRPVL